MQIKVKIDTVDKTSSIQEDTLRIESVITKRIDTCRIVLEGEHAIVEGASEIVISNVAETIRYFAGYIARIARDVDGLTKLYDCDCQDYTVLADSVLVNEVYENKSDAQIINALFTKYLPEVNSTTYVGSGRTHERIVFNRVTLRQALDTLSSASGYDWDIDYYKKLHYFTKETNLAPFGISDTPDNEATFACSRLKYTREATKLVNKVTVVGGTYYSDDAEFELANNGEAKELLMPYKMHAPVDEAGLLVYRNDGNDDVPDWTPLNVGIDYIDALGDGIDVLHNYQEKLLRLDVAPANLKRAVKIVGRYDVPIIVRMFSMPSYAKYGRWYEDKVVDKSIESKSEAKLVVKSVLAECAFNKESGDFICEQDGLTSGQLIPIENALRGINDSYLINRVVLTILGGDKCAYHVFYGNYNPDLVDMIIAIKAQATQYQERREDELLSDILDQEETLALSEATDLHSDASPASRWIALPPTQSEGCHVAHEKLALAEATSLTSILSESYVWQGELLSNISFEDGDPPTGWAKWFGGGTWARSNEQAKSGTYSGKIIRVTSDTVAYFEVVNYAYFKGKQVTLRAEVYATVANRARISLNDGVTNYYSSYHSGVAGWELLTLTPTISADATRLYAVLGVYNGDTSAYFDDGSLIPTQDTLWDFFTWG